MFSYSCHRLLLLLSYVYICILTIDVKEKDYSALIAAVVRDFQLGGDFLDPCRLLPLVELSPAVLLEDILVRNEIHDDRKINEESKQALFRLMQEIAAYATCLFSVELDEKAAKQLILQWLSSYRNSALRKSKEKSMQVAMVIGKHSGSARECRSQTVHSLKANMLTAPKVEDVQPHINYVTDRLKASGVPAYEIVPTIAPILTACLLKASISEKQKTKIPFTVEAVSLFYDQLLSMALTKVIGEGANRDLVADLLKGISSAKYVEKTESDRRISVLKAAFAQAQMCSTALTVDDCITMADVSAIEDSLSPLLESEETMTMVHQTQLNNDMMESSPPYEYPPGAPYANYPYY